MQTVSEHHVFVSGSGLEGPTPESRQMTQQTEIQLALNWAVVDCCLHGLRESLQNPSGVSIETCSKFHIGLVRCSPLPQHYVYFWCVVRPVIFWFSARAQDS